MGQVSKRLVLEVRDRTVGSKGKDDIEKDVVQA